MRTLVTGADRRDAAHSLGISISTLHTHLRRALRKSDCADVSALIWSIIDRRDRLRRYRTDEAGSGTDSVTQK